MPPPSRGVSRSWWNEGWSPAARADQGRMESPEAIHRPCESDLRRRSVGVAVEVVDGGADDRSAAALLDDDGTAAAPGRLGRGKVEREGHRLTRPGSQRRQRAHHVAVVQRAAAILATRYRGVVNVVEGAIGRASGRERVCQYV